MSPRCLVRGSLNIDEFFHVQGIVRPGQTISSTGFERRGGGKGANQAAAVARAGEPVSIVGAVGDDGAWLLRDLKEMGVSVDGVCTVSEPTGRAIIQLTPAGENCIILHKGANYALQDTPAQIEQSLLGMSHLLLQNEIPWQTTVAYLTHAHDRGLVTVFNPSPMPSDDEIREFPWEKLSWLVVNEGEAESLLRVLKVDVNEVNPSVREEDQPTLPALETLEKLARNERLQSTNIV